MRRLRIRARYACGEAPRPVAASELSFITGASMFLTRRFVEDVGLFDESYFMYMENADLCQRALLRGWRFDVAPESVIYHKGGWTVNDGFRECAAVADRLQRAAT